MRSILYTNIPWSFEISLILCGKHLHPYFTDAEAVSAKKWRSLFLCLVTVLDTSQLPDFLVCGNCSWRVMPSFNPYNSILTDRHQLRWAGDKPATVPLVPLALLRAYRADHEPRMCSGQTAAAPCAGWLLCSTGKVTKADPVFQMDNWKYIKT